MEPPVGRSATSGRLLAVAAVAVVVWYGVGLLGSLAAVLLLGFLGILVACGLSIPIDRLSRVMPRPVALLVTVVALVGAGVGLVLFVAPTLVAQAQRLSQLAPAALVELERAWSRVTAGHLTAGAPPPTLSAWLSAHASEILGGAVGVAVPLARSALGYVGGTLVVGFLALFFVVEPALYRGLVERLVPSGSEPLVRELWSRLGVTLRRWFLGTLLSMIFVGLCVGLGLALLGVEGAATLGVLSFAANFVPYVGPMIAAVPGLLAALAHSPSTALLAVAVYLVVPELEGKIFTPLVMRQAVTIPPALLLLWQLAMGTLLGVFGLLIAAPSLACAQVLVEALYVERRLGKPRRT